ncbi:PREDICTED: opticin [Tinamus guttatus]|uniref:opticin n=1 Tax=Tinamus guttatus TaxID=94827 RepID=UPI00052E7837|nr:PREDICTED: opticin [Tinamus guttatus]
MGRVAGLGIASLLLMAAWAAPADEGTRKEEKPGDDPTAYENLDLDNYDLPLDNYGEMVDLSNYEELYDYGDLAPKIEVGTLAPRSKAQEAPPGLGTTAGTLDPQPPSPSGHPGALEPVTAGAQLKCIDLTSNSISRADADAFRLLPKLQELLLPGNRLTALPELPRSLVRLDARLNHIPSTGLRPDAFRDLTQLQFLHLSDNELDFIPAPLPQSLRSLHLQNNNIRSLQEDTFCDSRDHGHVRRALEDIRLDGNPINLSLFPDAYFCLPRLPTGRFH